MLETTLCLVPLRRKRTNITLLAVILGHILVSGQLLSVQLRHIDKDDFSLLQLVLGHLQGIRRGAHVIEVMGLDGQLELVNRQITVGHYGEAIGMSVPSLFPEEKGIYIKRANYHVPDGIIAFTTLGTMEASRYLNESEKRSSRTSSVCTDP